MTKQDSIDKHNREILNQITGKKQVTITPKKVSIPEEDKLGAKEIRQAYFKNWYESCKDIYNKERRRKRKERKKVGKGNG